MKYIIKESQLTIIEMRLKYLNKIMNLKLPKKYNWFKKIDIDNVSSNSSYRANLQGTILVDIDWAEEQYKRFYPSRHFDPLYDRTEFGELIGAYDPIIYDMINYVNMVFTSSFEDISYDGMYVNFL